ncbi:MAG: methyltransferase domain-containing protein [Chitinophagaceae bacterium]|nr:MAG: methyltransferase domain-containing protein [Chitinophagaceae bacterium]
MDLKNRSPKKELLDADNIPFEHIRQNMRELDRINHLLGGHRITLKGLGHFLKDGNQSLSICEVGCGGGDNLRAIYNYCQKKKIPTQLIGIDMKPECIEYARQQHVQLPVQWICSDYKEVVFEQKKPDIVFSSLFCHHFNNKALVAMLGWMQQNSQRGFFINDLHRHAAAYYSIAFITGLFSRSYLVKHDAPLSVARGFRKKEWDAIFAEAGIRQYHLNWMWAFRHLIVYKK